MPNPALTLARAVAERIPSAHPAQLKGELRLLLNVLSADPACRELLKGLAAREEDRLLPYITILTVRWRTPAAVPLEDLATPGCPAPPRFGQQGSKPSARHSWPVRLTSRPPKLTQAELITRCKPNLCGRSYRGSWHTRYLSSFQLGQYRDCF